MHLKTILDTLDIEKFNLGSSTGQNFIESPSLDPIKSFSPVDGSLIAEVQKTNTEVANSIVQTAKQAQVEWRKIPAPVRGEYIRQFSNILRDNKHYLGSLVSFEMGKSLQEGLGEVQEMIDICDFSVGLSRQLHGLTMHSERLNHRMYEQWHPLGVVGIITAFNFPVAVWAWNMAIATVCGNTTIWKPSEKTPLTAIACTKLFSKVLKENNLSEGICNLMIGDIDPIGKIITDDQRITLVSATGSTEMGRKVSQKVAKRFGKTILELGGNNAVILSSSCDLKIAIPGLVFGAVGTAGQRCTTTRRAIVHHEIFETVKSSLIKAYSSIKIGNPLDENNHMGPLIDHNAVQQMQDALEEAKKQGGNIIFGGEILENSPSNCYVTPAIVEVNEQINIMKKETFAPILYLIKYNGDIEEAIHVQNDVHQGLSSALFTKNIHESETFLSHNGSDCGIANINIGTSGAEIGGAFGGEKETGGGRESGSDAWKSYMRRQTNTINYGKDLPLAQGIKFDI